MLKRNIHRCACQPSCRSIMSKDVHVGLAAVALVLLFVISWFAGCAGSAPASQQPVATPAAVVTAAPLAAVSVPAATTAPVATGPRSKLLIATTTSLYDTGLLAYLQPKFESQYNVDLLITSQGTGKAIEIAKNGDADVLLVHSATQELAFMQTGKGLNRRSFASNSFIIVGPPTDPAGIVNMTPEAAF